MRFYLSADTDFDAQEDLQESVAAFCVAAEAPECDCRPLRFLHVEALWQVFG